MSEKYCSMLLKQLYKLKLNSKFGIYLSKVQDKDDDGIKLESNHSDEMSMTNLLNKNLYQNKNCEISIGDVGIAFKEARLKWFRKKLFLPKLMLNKKNIILTLLKYFNAIN